MPLVLRLRACRWRVPNPRYLAATHGKLLVDIPIGRTAVAGGMQRLQAVLNSVVGTLPVFGARRQTTQETLDVIRAGLKCLAWHHGNVRQHKHGGRTFQYRWARAC